MLFIVCDESESNGIKSNVLVNIHQICAFEIVETDISYISVSLINGQILKMCNIKDFNEGIDIIGYIASDAFAGECYDSEICAIDCASIKKELL